MSTLLRAAIQGKSDLFIVGETVRRLDDEIKKNGKDTFTIGDLRRIKKSIYVGEKK